MITIFKEKGLFLYSSCIAVIAHLGIDVTGPVN